MNMSKIEWERLKKTDKRISKILKFFTIIEEMFWKKLYKSYLGNQKFISFMISVCILRIKEGKIIFKLT